MREAVERGEGEGGDRPQEREGRIKSEREAVEKGEGDGRDRPRGREGERGRLRREGERGGLRE